MPAECSTGCSMTSSGTAGNPFQTTQGNRLSCRDQEGRRVTAETGTIASQGASLVVPAMLAGARPCSGPVVLYMPRAHRSPLAGGVWEALVPGRQSHRTPLPEPALPACLGPSACPAPFPGLDSEAQGAEPVSWGSTHCRMLLGIHKRADSCPFVSRRAKEMMMACNQPPERNHGEGNGNPLQYSCLENPMDGGAW